MAHTVTEALFQTLIYFFDAQMMSETTFQPFNGHGLRDEVEDVDMSKSANLSIMTSSVKVTVQARQHGTGLRSARKPGRTDMYLKGDRFNLRGTSRSRRDGSG